MQHFTIYHVVATVLLILGGTLTQSEFQGALLVGFVVIGLGLLVFIYDYHNSHKKNNEYKRWVTLLMVGCVVVAVIVAYFLVSPSDIAYAKVTDNKKWNESEFITEFDFNVKSEFTLRALDIDVIGQHLKTVEPHSKELYKVSFENPETSVTNSLALIRLKNVVPGSFGVKITSDSSDPDVSLSYHLEHADSSEPSSLVWLWGLLSLNIPTWFVLLLTVAEGSAFYFILRIRKPKSFFFDYDRVRWRANKRTGKVEEHPYCPDHPDTEVQLVWDSNESYYCPLDGARNFPSKYDITDTRKGAQNVANAILDGLLDEKQTGAKVPSESTRQRILRTLPLDEKKLLRSFMDGKPQRHRMEIGSTAWNLRTKKVLRTPPQADENGTVTFEITEWAYEMLKQNPHYLQ